MLKKSLIAALAVIFLASCGSLNLFNKSKSTFKVKKDGIFAEMQTNKGNILIELFYEKTPLTVANFVGLAEGTLSNGAKENGEPYYDGLVFHRVIDDFMVQGGDPTGTGRGGPGYKFPDEIHPELKHDSAGILSMANAGPGTNGSQFFITHKETPWLNGKHTVFGAVQEGMDVVNSIEQGDSITKLIIIRNGEAAKNFSATDEAFEELKKGVSKRMKEGNKQALKTMAEKECKGKEVQETGNGLFYCITEPGNGNKPKKGDKIKAKYKGSFTDGRMFDKGEIAFELITGRVIEGWHLGFAELTEGAKATLYIPYWHGYGENDQFGGQMPGRSNLVFEVELVKIK